MVGTPGSAALQTIFGVLQGIAGDIQSGLLTVVAPIAIAVCLYFLVRMLLASDAKDVATYRNAASRPPSSLWSRLRFPA